MNLFGTDTKQIVIIDNSGSQSAQSSTLETRLDRSLSLVRKRLYNVDSADVSFYLWNQDLQLLELDSGLYSVLSRVSASHLPDGDFIVLLNAVKRFRERGFQVAFFTDALNSSQQSSLGLLGVETFLSAHENRNIFFESISHSSVGNSEIELRMILGCTSFGGSTKVVVSSDKFILMEKKIELKQNDREEIKLRLLVTPDMDHLMIEHKPQEADNLKEDDKIMYLLSSQKMRVNFVSFQPNKPDLIFLKNFFSDESNYETTGQSPDIQFVAVRQIPEKPQPYTVFVLQSESNFSQNHEFRSQIVESEHPLLRYIDGTKFSASSNSISVQTQSNWKSLVQIKSGDSGKSVPGLLVHSKNNSCLTLNLDFTNRHLGNFDYLILLENISRHIREIKQRRALIEVGDSAVSTAQIFTSTSELSSPQKVNRISMQGLYQNSDGFKFFARFPSRESKLANSEKISSLERFTTNELQSSGKFEKKIQMAKQYDAYWSSILIFFALILMTLEWYLFSKRA